MQEMSLRVRLGEDLKQAMRDRDGLRRSTIRYLLSAIHNEEIAQQKTLDDDGIVGVLGRQAQQRRDSIEAYTKANRQDLADKEKAELATILGYLPEQMSDEDITSLVQQVIDEVGAKGPQDMGTVMGKVMPQVRGRAEGRRVSSIASELLKALGA
jgi:uncharacterized protein YqeY